MPDWGWLFFAYLSGSVATGVLLYKSVALRSIEMTIDNLIDSGYLRHKLDREGNVEIMKWNSLEDTVNESTQD